ncbi:hypothetical protein Hte_008491 [Hypoxylon texense]
MSQAMGLPSRKGKEERPTSLVTRACDMCRKKKIRCEAGSGAAECQAHAKSISYVSCLGVPDKRVEELEKRLKWMEEQLKRVVKVQQSETDAESSNEPMGLERPSSDRLRAGTYSNQTMHESPSLDSGYAMAEGFPQGSRLGASSENAFSPSPQRQLVSSPWNLISAKSASATKIIQALPPKDKALELIRKSFDGFHSAYPIFDQASFLYKFEYMDINMSDPSWWACLNVVLALAHRFEEPASLEKREDLEAWGFFQNALAVSNQLVTLHSTLASVQALLGMALVLQGTPNQGPVSLLTSSAIKLAQRMGLHKRCQDTSLNAAEIEERKKVFWVAYALDKDISLQTGQPPTQDDDYMDVEFPFQNWSTLNNPSESDSLDFFHFRVKLALIQGQIYHRLCSVEATRKTPCERRLAARELESMLRAWRATVPVDFLRDFSGSELELSTSAPFRHPIILQLTYFNSLAIVYGSLPLLPGNCEVKGPDDPLAYQMSTPITYPGEARQVIKLLEATPRRNFACVWSGLHIFVSATTILLTHTLWNPSNPFASADLKYVEPLLDLLAVLAKSGESNNISETYTSCFELLETARLAVDNSGIAGMSWDQPQTGVQSGERESVEDFLRRMESISSEYDADLASMSSIFSQEFEFGHQI